MKAIFLVLLTWLGFSDAAHAAFSVPGRIQVEDYISGSNGDQYRDTTAGNSGGAYRKDDVDIVVTRDGGYKVGYTDNGEWLKYPITVSKSGTYYLRFRVSRGLSGTSTGGIQAQINGSPITNVVQVPSTGNWESFTTITQEVQLSAGTQTLSLYFAGGGFDVNWVEFVLKSATATPTPTPTPAPTIPTSFSIPSRIQVEDYMAGTNGSQYRDTTSGNTGGAYRKDDVDVAATADGGYKVGNIANGEWLKYQVNITQAGTYYLRLRVARGYSGSTTGGIQPQIDGTPLMSAISIPSTGGWETFTTITKEVTLPQGSHVLSLYFNTSGFDVNWMEFELKGTTTTPSPSPTATPPSPTPSPTPERTPSSVPVPTGLSGNFTMIFQDEFNGTALDSNKWNIGYRWSQNVDGGPQTIINNESQYYHRNNVSVHDGALDLVMKNEYMQGQPYTSGAVSSHDKFFFTYGIMEARMKVPAGDGLWPAFWAMFQDPAKPYREIDVLELSGRRTYEAAMTYHWDTGNSGWHAYQGPDFSAGYHTFAVEWSPTALVWYIDGVERYRFTDTAKIVNFNMYLLLNLAMAPKSCNWIGCPDSNALPAHLMVDYVRVWKRN